MPQNVILMNPFQIRLELADLFLSRWKLVADFLKRQPGFVSTRLHRGLVDQTQWFNYAEWKTADDFRDAISTDEFRALTKDFLEEGRPTLYTVCVSLWPAQ